MHLVLLVSILFVLFSIIAGVEVWKALFDLALLMGKPDGEEEVGFNILKMSPRYNDPAIPLSVLAAIAVGYVLFILFTVKFNKQKLRIACFFLTVVCFFLAPYIIGWSSELADYFL